MSQSSDPKAVQDLPDVPAWHTWITKRTANNDLSIAQQVKPHVALFGSK